MERNRIAGLIFMMVVLFVLSVVIGCMTSGGAGVNWGEGIEVVY